MTSLQTLLVADQLTNYNRHQGNTNWEESNFLEEIQSIGFDTN